MLDKLKLQSSFEERTGRAQERAKAEAGVRSAEAKRLLGERVLDLTEEHFPEQTQQRRRDDLTKAFVAGVVVGAVLPRLLNR